MDAGFKSYVLESIANSDNEIRQKFIRALKFEPESAAKTIKDNIVTWTLRYALKEDRAVTDEPDGRELLQALKEHFAAELAAITE